VSGPADDLELDGRWRRLVMAGAYSKNPIQKELDERGEKDPAQAGLVLCMDMITRCRVCKKQADDEAHPADHEYDEHTDEGVYVTADVQLIALHAVDLRRRFEASAQLGAKLGPVPDVGWAQ
jgi:hypothetical protein